MGKRRRDSEVSSSSDSSTSSSSTGTSGGSSTDSYVASRRKKSSKRDTSPDRIQKDPSNPKASGSGKASAASVALSKLIQATLRGAGEENPVLAHEAAEEGEGEAGGIEAPARAAAAADGVAQERPNPAVGQALLAASFIEAQHAPKSNRKKRLKPSIKQSRRMLKRLRREVSNKRVGQLKSKYRLDVEDSMDFKVPSIDFEMLQKLLGPSTGK
jgi:CCR4-NOT transcriptional regulation complex NOT5 subunit